MDRPSQLRSIDTPHVPDPMAIAAPVARVHQCAGDRVSRRLDAHSMPRGKSMEKLNQVFQVVFRKVECRHCGTRNPSRDDTLDSIIGATAQQCARDQTGAAPALGRQAVTEGTVASEQNFPLVKSSLVGLGEPKRDDQTGQDQGQLHGFLYCTAIASKLRKGVRVLLCLY